MIAPYISDSFEMLPLKLTESGFSRGKVMLVGDTNTMPIYGNEAGGYLSRVFDGVFCHEFKAGEEHKNLRSVEELLLELLDRRFERGDCVAALGGGVTGDMAGFAAAVYLRGIRVIQLPTTLLAQIDSSIGGKTAVDFNGYKNMVGAFHMPELVYANTSVLKTLPKEQFAAGMGEVIKSAVLGDRELFYWLAGHRGDVMNLLPDALTDMISQTAAIKTGIVTRDPKEQGERALLNLGHTIGHAIEKYMNFEMLHGECVAVGTSAALRISRMRGMIDEAVENEVNALFRDYGLQTKVPGLPEDKILEFTKSDKKMKGGKIRFILPAGIGSAVVSDDVTEEELLCGIRAVTAQKTGND